MREGNINVCVKAYTSQDGGALVDLKEGVARRVLPDQTAAQLQDSLGIQLCEDGYGISSIEGIQVLAGDKPIAADAPAGTGMVARLDCLDWLGQPQQIDLKLSVLGDVAAQANGCGDGTVGYIDYMRAQQCALQISGKELEGLAADAADLRYDGQVTYLDVMQLCGVTLDRWPISASVAGA